MIVPSNNYTKALHRSPLTSSKEYLGILGIKLVNKHQAAEILGISPETLKRYRLQEGSTLIPGVHYFVWNSRVVRYNAALIADWGLNRNTPELHQKAIDAFLALLPANQPAKRGRRKA